MAAANEIERVKVLMEAVSLFSGHLMENQGDYIMAHIFKSLGAELPEGENPFDSEINVNDFAVVEAEVVDA